MGKEVARRDKGDEIDPQLEALRESARRSAAELEKFSFAVSHDLRSPLRAVLGYSAALQEDYGDRLDADGHRYLERITMSARKMDELIGSILSFSRITRAEMSCDEVDISQLATTIVAELSRHFPHVDVQIQPRIVVTGDRALLRIVLFNLLQNAFKFCSAQEHPQIKVSASNGLGENPVAVSDNGIGFEPDQAERVFGPFEKLDPQSELSGVGIGLYNVRRIIERHHGRVWAVSQPGAGATFYFTTG